MTARPPRSVATSSRPSWGCSRYARQQASTETARSEMTGSGRSVTPNAAAPTAANVNGGRPPSSVVSAGTPSRELEQAGATDQPRGQEDKHGGKPVQPERRRMCDNQVLDPLQPRRQRTGGAPEARSSWRTPRTRESWVCRARTHPSSNVKRQREATRLQGSRRRRRPGRTVVTIVDDDLDVRRYLRGV